MKDSAFLDLGVIHQAFSLCKENPKDDTRLRESAERRWWARWPVSKDVLRRMRGAFGIRGAMGGAGLGTERPILCPIPSSSSVGPIPRRLGIPVVRMRSVIRHRSQKARGSIHLR